MLHPNKNESVDLTASLHEDKRRRLDERDIEVAGIEIPPVAAPVVVAPPVVAPAAAAEPEAASTPEPVTMATPKKSKAWLLVPVLMLAGGAGVFYKQPLQGAVEPLLSTMGIGGAPKSGAPAPVAPKPAGPKPAVVRPAAPKPAVLQPAVPRPDDSSEKPNPNRDILKELWKKGAAAKKRGDFAAARAAWQEGLKIEPDNVGFQESIAKLGSAGR